MSILLCLLTHPVSSRPVYRHGGAQEDWWRPKDPPGFGTAVYTFARIHSSWDGRIDTHAPYLIGTGKRWTQHGGSLCCQLDSDGIVVLLRLLQCYPLQFLQLQRVEPELDYMLHTLYNQKRNIVSQYLQNCNKAMPLCQCLLTQIHGATVRGGLSLLH